MEPERIARSNADDAYHTIRRLILTSELPPGTPFTESELVKRIGLGKTPVREALGRLRLERLVVVRARSGYQVAPVTLKDVRDTHQVLSYLEKGLSRHLASTPGVVPHLVTEDAKVRRTEMAEGSDDESHAWIAADYHFHCAFARASDNTPLAEFCEQLHRAIVRFRNLAVVMGAPSNTFAHSHSDLLEALASGNGPAAADASQDLWRASETLITGLLASTSAVMRTNVWDVGEDSNTFYLDAIQPSRPLSEVFADRSASQESTPSQDKERV